MLLNIRGVHWYYVTRCLKITAVEDVNLLTFLIINYNFARAVSGPPKTDLNDTRKIVSISVISVQN